MFSGRVNDIGGVKESALRLDVFFGEENLVEIFDVCPLPLVSRKYAKIVELKRYAFIKKLSQTPGADPPIRPTSTLHVASIVHINLRCGSKMSE